MRIMSMLTDEEIVFTAVPDQGEALAGVAVLSNLDAMNPWLDTFSVNPGWLDQGVNESLMATLINFCLQGSYTGITTWSDPSLSGPGGGQPVFDFLATVGFKMVHDTAVIEKCMMWLELASATWQEGK